MVTTEIIFWTLQELRIPEWGEKGINSSQEQILYPLLILWVWTTPARSSSSKIWRLEVSSYLCFKGSSQTSSGKCLISPRHSPHCSAKAAPDGPWCPVASIHPAEEGDANHRSLQTHTHTHSHTLSTNDSSNGFSAFGFRRRKSNLFVFLGKRSNLFLWRLCSPGVCWLTFTTLVPSFLFMFTGSWMMAAVRKASYFTSKCSYTW